MQVTDYPVVVQLPVQWSDLDMYAHVNNCVYLRWIESARVAYWDNSGLRGLLEPSDLGPILASVKCDYKQQLDYPDTINVTARIRYLGKTSLHMEHIVTSEAHQDLAAKGLSVIVMFDYEQQRKQEISNELRSHIEAFEGRSIV